MSKSISVLVVDDCDRVRDEIKIHYQGLGHKVVGEARNGLEALEKIEQLKPDLVSLDIIMPEMDGVECYRNLKQKENPPRCLIVSALAAEHRIVEALQEEISPNFFLSKNFTRDQLRDKVEEVMGQAELPPPPA